MHLTDGEIRAYQDHELEPVHYEQVKMHLASCSQCQWQAETLQARAQRVGERFSALVSGAEQVPASSGAARAKLDTRLKSKPKEYETMFQNLTRRISRPAWAALMALLIVAVALAFPPVRAIANSFLGLFRVQQVAVVQINPGALPQQLGSSAQLESMMSTDVQFEEHGDLQEVATAAEASQAAGIPVRLPTQAGGDPKLAVTPTSGVTFNLDLDHIQAVLEEIDRTDIQLPENLDGATVEVDIPSGVTAMYGDCQFELESVQDRPDPDQMHAYRRGNCTTLMQMPSPTVSAPAGLDIAQIGEAFLQVMGMSPEEAQDFSHKIDWATTLVVPIPRYDTTYQEVTVDGVQGTLIREERERSSDEYMLMWVKDGVVYVLNGNGSLDQAVEIANSLQ